VSVDSPRIAEAPHSVPSRRRRLESLRRLLDRAPQSQSHLKEHCTRLLARLGQEKIRQGSSPARKLGNEAPHSLADMELDGAPSVASLTSNDASLNEFMPRPLHIPGVSRQHLWEWHSAPGAFERLTPPFDPAEVVERSEPFDLRDGSVTLKVPLPVLGALGLGLKITARHCPEGFREGHQFVDTMAKEFPFVGYEHTHMISGVAHKGETNGEQQEAQLIDSIRYRLVGGMLGNMVGALVVHAKFAAMFAYRHNVTRDDLLLHAHCDWRFRGSRVAVAGASGLIGSTIVPMLTTGGAHVIRLCRGHPGPSDACTSSAAWDPKSGIVDTEALEGCDAVIHVAGRGIAKPPFRWTENARQEILESRVQGTRVLCEALARMRQPPKVFVMASGVAYYGDTNACGTAAGEDTAKGSGFLSDVVQAWEAAAQPARAAGIRVVCLRYGAVLSTRGGAVKMMLPVFKMGLGGCLGSGNQHMPWISVDDAAGVALHAICDDSLFGSVNAVAPSSATNMDFTNTLAGILHRPAISSVALDMLLGDFAKETMLVDQHVAPTALQQSGYPFRHADLDAALRHILGRL